MEAQSDKFAYKRSLVALINLIWIPSWKTWISLKLTTRLVFADCLSATFKVGHN